MPIFKLDDAKIRKNWRVVLEKKFRQTDKERNGQAHKQGNRQIDKIDKRINRKKKQQQQQQKKKQKKKERKKNEQ